MGPISDKEMAILGHSRTIEAVLPVKYCLYARKSTEDDERQALSIESQVKEMLEQAQKDHLNIAEIKRESHSAKDSGERPVFNELMREIKESKFDGILTWAPDRLSRNAGDLGSIVDLMDGGMIKEIRTHGQTFINSPNEKFLLMILCSQAKLENDNKGENVKRGLRAKVEMGWRPGMPPLGYLHDKNGDKGKRRAFTDPKRAPVMKQLFDKVAYEGWSGRAIYKWLNDMDFRTRSGKRMTLSSIYLVLKNTYYYGYFEYPVGSGNWYKGEHEPIITKETFDEAQIQLTVAPKSKPGTKEFSFTKMIKCGSCGSGVTAEEKYKKLSDGSVKKYIYYHCSRFNDLKCKESYIREENLTIQLIKLIDRIDMDQLKTQKRIKEEIDRYQKFTKNILGVDNKIKMPEINMKDYARYVLTDGTREEIRELFNCLDTELKLKEQKIYI